MDRTALRRSSQISADENRHLAKVRVAGSNPVFPAIVAVQGRFFRLFGFWRSLVVSLGSREPVALFIVATRGFFESGGCAAQSADELQESVPSGLGGRGEALPTRHIPMA